MLPARFDLCILGAGPAGYAAAIRAYDLGKKVALVERDRVGGTGLHCGALSSKTLWHLSNDFAVAARTDRGYGARELQVSYPAVMGSVRSAVAERREQLLRQLECLARPSERGGQVTLLAGTARFLSPGEVGVEGAGERRGDHRIVRADRFLIATGSRPRRPAGIDIDGEHILTSDHIEDLPDFPKSMVVMGAGVVGCEYATIFGNYRHTKINIIDQQPRILPFEDADVAEVIERDFEAMGVTIHRESRLTSMRVVDGQVEYVLQGPDGPYAPIRVERALVSIGRVPNTDGLDLERAGVKLCPGGGIQVQDTRSSTPHIYAAGDTTLDIALVNLAELEGRQAVELMFGLAPPPIRYEALSAIMFLAPEVASVGLNEQQAQQRKIPYRVARLHNRLISRNIAMRATTGFIKLLAAPGEHGEILGLRVVGPQASSTIQGVAFLIDRRATLLDIDHCIHPHPAIPEGVQECARLLLGRSIYKPEVFGPDLLRCDAG